MGRKYKDSKAKFALAGVMSLSMLSNVAYAQDEQAGDDNKPSVKLEEITVTAQKRPQNLQDVPVAVYAVSGETISKLGVGNFEDIEVPGVTVSRGGMTDAISVRGVGSDSNLGFEQSVPLYVDGLYFGRARTQRIGFMDVGGIEFLKGPQPTHLGKNAVAGAINITSKRPTDELEVELDGFYELNHKELSLFGAVSGPLSDKVRARTAVKYRSLDGWVNNVVTDNMEPNQKEIMGRVNFEIDVSDDLSVNLSAFASSTEDKGRNNVAAICGTSGLLYDAIFNSGGYCAEDKASLDLKTLVKASGAIPSLYTDEDTTFYNKSELMGFSMKMEYDMDGYTVSSVTGYYDFKNRYFADADHSTLRRLEAHFPEDFNQFSQELRVLSPQEEAFKWTAGAYYDKNNNDTGSTVTIPFVAMGMGTTVFRDAREDAESWSVFAEASLDVSEDVTMTVGGRYSEVTKSIDYDRCNAPMLIALTDADYTDDPEDLNFDTIGCTANLMQLGEGHTVAPARKDTKFQPAVTLEWRPNGDSLVYASWKEGFKAGGFDHGLSGTRVVTNANLADSFTFEPEEVSSFEIGAKIGLLDGAAELNISAFTSSFTNLQLSVLEDPVSLTFSVSNAGKAKTQGIEADFRWAASEYLTLTAGAIVLDSKYVSFLGAPCFSGQSATEGCVGGVQDLSGHKTTYAPDFSGTLAADFSYPLNDSLELVSQISTFYTGDIFTTSDFDPAGLQEAYAKVDLRLGVGNVDEGWEIAVLARNLTNKYTTSLISDLPTLGAGMQFALLDRPRSIAIQARMKF